MNTYKLILNCTFISFFVVSNHSCTTNKSYISDETSFLEEISIKEIQSGYQNNRYTVNDIVSAYIDRINSIDQSGPYLNSVLTCLLYTSPSPRDLSTSRMPSSA